MKQAIVIGGGPAGIMAAGQCALKFKTVLLEANGELGKKLALTGKGRCNFTNIVPVEEHILNMPGNGPFLFSSLSRFHNDDLISFFRNYGVLAKVERGGRVFPVTDSSTDIIRALKEFLKERKVEIRYKARVKEVMVKDRRVVGVKLFDGSVLEGDIIILATGGASYPQTGSRGDGYTMARKLGHTVIEPKPGLVPIIVQEKWVKNLQGLTLKNVSLEAFDGSKKVAAQFGEMLFTDKGISGPIVLTMSRVILPYLEERKKLNFIINLKPALTEEVLDNRLKRDFEQNSKKQFKNSLDKLLPQKMIPVVVSLSGIDPEKKTAEVSRAERAVLLMLLRKFPLSFEKLATVKEAIVTVGGVSVREINPKTMESRLTAGLYFCGEVIDYDGFTGGFNLQAAFSTGYTAGKNAR